MIFGDCDNNFVFINALQYKIYAYFFLFLGYKPKNQKNKTKKKKKKKANFWFWKKLGFLHPWINPVNPQNKII